MIRSRVTISATFRQGDGPLDTFEQSVGTEGVVDIGGNLGSVVPGFGRGIGILAKAAVVASDYDDLRERRLPPEIIQAEAQFVEAARGVLGAWEDFDKNLHLTPEGA